jgi:hypothetical protein
LCQLLALPGEYRLRFGTRPDDHFADDHCGTLAIRPAAANLQFLRWPDEGSRPATAVANEKSRHQLVRRLVDNRCERRARVSPQGQPPNRSDSNGRGLSPLQLIVSLHKLRNSAQCQGHYRRSETPVIRYVLTLLYVVSLEAESKHPFFTRQQVDLRRSVLPTGRLTTSLMLPVRT